MVLGLTPEAYVLYRCDGIHTVPEVVAVNGSLIFAKSFNECKAAAEAFIAIFVNDNVPPPKYLWIEPIHRLWVDGEVE